MSEPRVFFLLSDATGETAETVVMAALSQFREESVRLQRVSNVRSAPQARTVVAAAKESDALLFYTFVDRELAAFTERECIAQGVECLDLLGPLLHKMARYFDHSPKGTPGLLHEVGDEYFRRIEAMEFALNYDDGQRLQHLQEADIILVGVSRTSKTPLSVYLSYRGWRVANIPLVHGIEPPTALFEVPPQRVVGLFIDAKRLVERRTARLRSIGATPANSYSDFARVKEELRWARALCRDHGWSVVNVSGRSVEETAHDVLVTLKLK